jgi:hypothetical protein
VSLTGGLRSDAQSIASLLHNGASSTIRINSSEVASGNAGTQSIVGVRIGANAGSLDYLSGTINEVIIYDSDQSDNRVGIETNINDHYDIY